MDNEMSLYKFTVQDHMDYPFGEIWASAQRNASSQNAYEQECGFPPWPEHTVTLVFFETEEGPGEHDNRIYYFNVIKGNMHE